MPGHYCRTGSSAWCWSPSWGQEWPVQVLALQWIKKIQLEVSSSTEGIKTTERFSRSGALLHACFVVGHRQRVWRTRAITNRNQKLDRSTQPGLLSQLLSSASEAIHTVLHNMHALAQAQPCSQHLMGVISGWHMQQEQQHHQHRWGQGSSKNQLKWFWFCRVSLTAFNAQGHMWKDHQSLIMSANNIHIYVLNTVTILQFSTRSQHTESKVCIFMECIQGNSTTVIQFVITHPDFFYLFFFFDKISIIPHIPCLIFMLLSTDACKAFHSQKRCKNEVIGVIKKKIVLISK